MTTASSTTIPSHTTSQRVFNIPKFQNFHLVWLDENMDETNDYYRKSIKKFQKIVNTVNTFIDFDECIDFITDITEKCFMIMSGEFSRTIISIIQNIPQVSCVYIFHSNDVPYEEWAQKWSKVAGIHTDIAPIYEALKKATHDYDRNSVLISYIKKTDNMVNQNLDTLDPSFMYTQVLKEILLGLNFENVHFNEFITYCRKQFEEDGVNFDKVDIIEKEYSKRQPIFWYTKTDFLYSMVNKALRTLEADLIVNMGFFVRDLHNDIAQLHFKQYGEHQYSKPFVVYRGQGLSQTSFDQLQATIGGLLAFNNFLSTSLNREVSYVFAESNANNPDLIGVLFKININPLKSSTPFANICDVSHFQDEEEILFSMHSVFRIGKVKQIDKNNNRLWKVELTLTDDHDPELQYVTQKVQEVTMGPTGWFRLALLMIKVAQFDKAQQVFQIMLDRVTDEKERGDIYYFLGRIKYDQGKYTEAITQYEKSLEILQRVFPANHPRWAVSYDSIGTAYLNMGENSKAFTYYEKTLEILQKVLPVDHFLLANSYNNIGGVYSNMGEYSKALSYYIKGLESYQKTCLHNHPVLATSYNNIGLMYQEMGENSKALSFLEKSLEILQKTLPANHPNLAIIYSNMAGVYFNMGDFLKAFSSFQKAFEIDPSIAPENHPVLTSSYNNIPGIVDNMDDSKALSYYEKALEMRQKTLPPDHPDLAQSYNNIGLLYQKMGEHSKALSSFEKALEIQEKALPSDHPDLAQSYNNIGLAYQKMGKHSKAISLLERSLKIQPKNVPASYPSLTVAYQNIGHIYYEKGESLKALSSFENALEILQKIFPTNHFAFADIYHMIAQAYNQMGKHWKALPYYEKALEMRQKTLPPDHPDLAQSYNNIGLLYQKMGEYPKAVSSLEKALEIQQKTVPTDHRLLAIAHKSIGQLYYEMDETLKALSSFEKALEIRQIICPENDPKLAELYNHIGFVYKNLGEYSIAASYFEHAFDILQHSSPPDDPFLLNVKKVIEIMKEKST